MKDTRWFKVVRNQDGQAFLESKILTDEALITVEEIAQEWPLWNDFERNGFISAYHQKKVLNEVDFQIYEFLMEHAHPCYKRTLYGRLKDLPDKKRTLDFLKKLINSVKLEKDDDLTESMFYNSVLGPLHHYYETIGLLGNCDAVSFLKVKILEMMEHQDFFKGGCLSNTIVYICVEALQVLCRLEPSEDNMKFLKGFRSHSESISCVVNEILRSLKNKDDKEGNEPTE